MNCQTQQRFTKLKQTNLMALSLAKSGTRAAWRRMKKNAGFYTG